MSPREGVFRYVTFHRIERYLAMGWWVWGELDFPHGEYAVVMIAPICVQEAGE